MPNTYNRFKFYNFFDHNLTTADLGRTFRITFWAKADRLGRFDYGLMSVGSGSSYSGTIYESDLNKKKTATLPDSWTQFTYDLTVDEGMLASTYIGHENDCYNPALFSIISTGLNGRNVYIDDIVIEETTQSKQPYYFRYDWDTETADTLWSFNGYEDGPNKVLVSSAENHTAGEAKAKSLKVRTDKTYNRVYFYNIIDTLTAQDVGRTISVNFFMKADKKGVFQLGMSNKSIAGGVYEGEARQTYTVNESDVGNWKKYTYDFTVNEGMVANGADLLTLYLTGFGQLSDGSVTANLYIDDLSSIERLEGPATNLNVDRLAVISNTGYQNPEAVVVARNDSVHQIRKAYLRFSGGEYETTQKATLDLQVLEAKGQKVKIYGIINREYPASLTFDNAPASNKDESMDLNYVFGGAPLGEITANAGVQSIDVTNYVKAQGAKDCIFAITTDDNGDISYTSIDFETFPLSPGIDYTAFGGNSGRVSLKDGAAVIEGVENAGQGIRLLNVFGSGGMVCKADESYTVSADVTPLGTNENGYEMMLGLCAKDGDVLSQNIFTSETIAANNTKKITLTFTANAETVSDGACALAVYCGSQVPEQGFSIDNVSVKSSNAVVISAAAGLSVYKAQGSGSGELPAISVRSFDSASATATVYATAPCTATVIFTGYNGSQLTVLKIMEVQLRQGDNKVMAEGFDTTGITSGQIMLWDDIVNLSPLCPAYEF